MCSPFVKYPSKDVMKSIPSSYSFLAEGFENWAGSEHSAGVWPRRIDPHITCFGLAGIRRGPFVESCNISTCFLTLSRPGLLEQRQLLCHILLAPLLNSDGKYLIQDFIFMFTQIYMSYTYTHAYIYRER